MAKRLQAQKRSEYQCPPKACPAPADLRRFPELMGYLRKEWRIRMDLCRSGKSRLSRASAKAQCRGRNQVKRRKQNRTSRGG